MKGRYQVKVDGMEFPAVNTLDDRDLAITVAKQRDKKYDPSKLVFVYDALEEEVVWDNLGFPSIKNANLTLKES